jgi:Putative lumazine-binding
VRPSLAVASLAVLLATAASPARAQSTAADSAGIRAAALDYIEGWYAGDADRMTRALHPRLAKRLVRSSAGRESSLDEMNAETLIGYTRAGSGKRTPTAMQRKGVRILDVFGGAASVRVDAAQWVDYLQLARWNGAWKIVNVLWETRP